MRQEERCTEASRGVALCRAGPEGRVRFRPTEEGAPLPQGLGSGHRDGDQDSRPNPTITTPQAGSHQDAAPASCRVPSSRCVCVCVCVCVSVCVEGGWGTDPSGTYSVFQVLDKRCMHAKSLQSCPTLCDPVDCSPPGSSVHRILQARILEWVAMPSSR